VPLALLAGTVKQIQRLLGFPGGVVCLQTAPQKSKTPAFVVTLPAAALGRRLN
jgi:hypothetical protein